MSRPPRGAVKHSHQERTFLSEVRITKPASNYAPLSYPHLHSPTGPSFCPSHPHPGVPPSFPNRYLKEDGRLGLATQKAEWRAARDGLGSAVSGRDAERMCCVQLHTESVAMAVRAKGLRHLWHVCGIIRREMNCMLFVS